MAGAMRWWVAAVLAACIGVGVVYLPPRSEPLRRSRFQVFDPPTPYQVRVRDLAARWRLTALELQLLAYRERLRPEMARRRALEVTGPALLFEGTDTLTREARDLVRVRLDSVWTGMGLGATKISVGVVLQVGRTAVWTDEPSWNGGFAPEAYLLPDSVDRTSCIALLSLDTTWGPGKTLAQTPPTATETLTRFLNNGLGPCAFHAAFGNPGRAVKRWLGARQFDLALHPWWNRAVREERSAMLTAKLEAAMNPMFWLDAYHYPPQAVACLGGRSQACRAAVLASAMAIDPPPRVVTRDKWWERQQLAGGGRYLADVVGDIGRTRFQEFWNSEAPVDTALTAALRQPIGEWTSAWQARLVPRIRLGPTAPLGDSLLGVMLAALAVALVFWSVGRREVR